MVIKGRYFNQPCYLRVTLENQLSNKDNVNPMTYFEMGLPPSISMGLSIDRWIQMLMDMNHISSIANPIELDHKRRCRQ